MGTSATTYAYNTAGQVTAIRRPTGDSISFGYDLAGRPSGVGFDRGSIGFTYHGTTGNLTSLSAPGGLGLAFTYDGALPTSVTWSGTVSGNTTVTYDNNFRVTGQTVNGANAVSFGYDLDGLLTQAGALGLRRDAQNGRLDADSVLVGGAVQKHAYTYDAHGALDALVSTRDADTLFATHYTRDSLSRITQLVERVAGVSQTIGFSYDSVGRLSAVARNGVTTASYTYDLNGNRATKTTSGGVATATVDDQDRLTSYGGATYAYTNNGELRRKIVGTDTTLYTYDALGNLTDVELPDGTAIGYLIDAQNRRIGKTVNDTLVRAWLYQGQFTPVAELDGQGTVVSRFVYATGVNVPDYLVRNDSTYRLIRDHLGSVRLVVNVASGSVAQRLSYDEFGIETENTNPAWQPFGYAGGLTDAQTGLVRFGARDYDPASGRWTAKDPIGFAGGSTSLYSYVANDPINQLDPSGLYVPDIVLWTQAFSVATDFARGVGSYARGQYRSARFGMRRIGLMGAEEKRMAALEDEALNVVLQIIRQQYMQNCDFRSLVHRELTSAAMSNKAFLAGRVGIGATITAIAGFPLGFAGALNASLGDLRHAMEVGSSSLPLEFIEAGLLGTR